MILTIEEINYLKANAEISTLQHRELKIIAIKFEYNDYLNSLIRKFTSPKWSRTLKSWYIADTTYHRTELGLEHEPITPSKLLKLSAQNQDIMNTYIQEIKLRGYSTSTMRTYVQEFSVYLETLNTHDASAITPARLRDYLTYCIDTLKLSESTVHSRINAIKFYYEKILKQDRFFFAIPRPKKPLKLPNVLAISQVERLFNQLDNLKHKTMIYLAYSAGLRVSEVVNMKVSDINSERMVIHIKGAKGKKDRIVALSDGILELLRKYYKEYQPKEWLFEGQYNGSPYHARSLQQVFNRAKQEARIIQPVTFHSLRHSYATHLHEAGTDINLIKELLGHNDLKTTLRYTHVSKRTIESIKSPFDSLNIKK